MVSFIPPYRLMELNGSINYTACNVGSCGNSDFDATPKANGIYLNIVSDNSWTYLPCYTSQSVTPSNEYSRYPFIGGRQYWSNQYPHYPAISTY